jgi:hypothetical protein
LHYYLNYDKSTLHQGTTFIYNCKDTLLCHGENEETQQVIMMHDTLFAATNVLWAW